MPLIYGGADAGEVCVDLFLVVSQVAAGWFLVPVSISQCGVSRGVVVSGAGRGR
jgi:hypothetical protein